jgi:hypothetical protein
MIRVGRAILVLKSSLDSLQSKHSKYAIINSYDFI